MLSELTLVQEQIDMALWLLVKHYRWMTKGLGRNDPGKYWTPPPKKKQQDTQPWQHKNKPTLVQDIKKKQEQLIRCGFGSRDYQLKIFSS